MEEAYEYHGHIITAQAPGLTVRRQTAVHQLLADLVTENVMLNLWHAMVELTTSGQMFRNYYTEKCYGRKENNTGLERVLCRKEGSIGQERKCYNRKEGNPGLENKC